MEITILDRIQIKREKLERKLLKANKEEAIEIKEELQWVKEMEKKLLEEEITANSKIKELEERIEFLESIVKKIRY